MHFYIEFLIYFSYINIIVYFTEGKMKNLGKLCLAIATISGCFSSDTMIPEKSESTTISHCQQEVSHGKLQKVTDFLSRHKGSIIVATAIGTGLFYQYFSSQNMQENAQETCPTLQLPIADQNVTICNLLKEAIDLGSENVRSALFVNVRTFSEVESFNMTDIIMTEHNVDSVNNTYKYIQKIGEDCLDTIITQKMPDGTIDQASGQAACEILNDRSCFNFIKRKFDFLKQNLFKRSSIIQYMLKTPEGSCSIEIARNDDGFQILES